jgi:hypothetical protein
MGSGIIETVGDLAISFPIIGSLATRYSGFFRDRKETFNRNFLYFRAVEQALLSLATLKFTCDVLRGSPLSMPAVTVGLGLSSVAYVCVALFKSRVLHDSNHKPFTGFVTKLYLEGVTLLKRKWQILESVTWIGVTGAFLSIGYASLARYPVMTHKVTTLGVGIAVGYGVLDLSQRVMKLFIST